jgi:hypothetical protein
MNHNEEQMKEDETSIHSKDFRTKQSREKEKVFYLIKAIKWRICENI